MSDEIFRNVQPIYVGFDSEISFSYVNADFWDALDMDTARLIAQFRASIDSATILATCDTLDATLLRDVSSRTLTFKIGSAKTAVFPDPIFFDIVAIGSPNIPIPGLWQWPVLKTVTRSVP